MSQPAGFFVGTEMPNTGWWEMLWPDPAAVLAQVGLKPGARAVDLCCGGGWFTLPMAQRAAKVTAIDIDPALIDVTRRRLQDAAISNTRFQVADAFDVASLAAPADFVFLANAFHGVPDRTRLARAVHDTLDDGGAFVIVNWHQRDREETTVLGEPRGPRTELRMSPQQTREAAEAGGLMLETTVDIPPYHYGAVFKRRAAQS